MNVKVNNVDVQDGPNTIRKKILVAQKDFSAGDVIYKEEPIVTTLDLDLEGKGTQCSHCFRQIQKGLAIRPESDRLDSVYCSKDCQVKSKSHYQGLLFTLEPPVPVELENDLGAPPKDARDQAQKAFVERVKEQGHLAPLLVAKFIARQVAAETAKMIPNTTTPIASEPSLVDGGDYSLYDHIERLRYLEVESSEQDVTLLRNVLQTAIPGLEHFVVDERYKTLVGKMQYNAYGVCFGGGRDDRPVSNARPEDIERTRTPYGTARQNGSGVYPVTAYCAHSCLPSARPSFSNGTAELHLIANRSINAGEEITVAYVDVTQHSDETPVEARRRRRMELARGWRFACACTRCVSEADQTQSQDDLLSQKDESKVEESIARIENANAASSA